MQDVLSSLHKFAFGGQNMKFTENMLPTCILCCDAGPGCDENCLQVQFNTESLVFPGHLVFNTVERSENFSNGIQHSNKHQHRSLPSPSSPHQATNISQAFSILRGQSPYLLD